MRHDASAGIDRAGSGRRIASEALPLELEEGGRRHLGGLLSRGGGRFHGTLVDARGPLLECAVTFRERHAGGHPVVEETRVYRALRRLKRALLTLRYDLEPVKRLSDGFLVIPALWYGDNEAWQGPKVPHPSGLSRDWSFRADGSSCPAVVWVTPRSSYAVSTRAETGWKDGQAGVDDVLGVGFEGMPSRPRAVFTFPAQEVPLRYRDGRKMKGALRPRMDWRRGAILSLTLRHHAGPPRRDFHVEVWKSEAALAPRSLRYPPVDLDATASLFTRCMKESHFLPGKGFKHRHDMPEIFSGWCGGFAAAHAALVHGEAAGDPEFVRMGETMCDYLCREGLSPCGIFNSENYRGFWFAKTVWGKGRGIPMRNPSEGAAHLALILERERRRGRFRAGWDAALRSNLDAVLRMMRSDGALPNEVHPRTGEALSWTGATAATWSGAWAVYARIDEDRSRARRYLRAAERAGAYYAREYVEKERYVGGPYDTWMAPNMEDPYNLLLAYSELYRTTGRRRWLDVAKRVADHLLSWRYLYDARFPDGTICRRHRVKTWAMSPASVSNKHVQNWDTLGDVYLLRLASWLKDPSYRDAAVQHLRASTQLVQKGQLPNGIPPGGQSEQWYATEFFWFGDCGDYGKGNLWQVSVVLPKAGFLLALDELKKSSPGPRSPK
jgi:hypothetical protein